MMTQIHQGNCKCRRGDLKIQLAFVLSDDDDEEDDEEELQRELARIKEERLAAQLLKQQQEREEQERVNTESALKGNPLINLNGDESAKVYFLFSILRI